MLTHTQEIGIRAFHDLDRNVAILIAQLQLDLYAGPYANDESEDSDTPYPGFVVGCRRLRALVDFCDLYVDEDGFVSSDCGDDMSYTLVEASQVKQIMLGRELAPMI